MQLGRTLNSSAAAGKAHHHRAAFDRTVELVAPDNQRARVRAAGQRDNRLGVGRGDRRLDQHDSLGRVGGAELAGRAPEAATRPRAGGETPLALVQLESGPAACRQQYR